MAKNKCPLSFRSSVFKQLHLKSIMFSKLDLREVHFLVLICEGNERKTAFRMSKGISNTLS